MVASPAAPYDPIYETEDEWTVHRYKLNGSGSVIRFAARDIRKERTGVHANIAISLNWVTLAWSNFNVEKDEDRVRLANSAYKHLDSKDNALDIAEFPSMHMKHALDLFCIGLWDETTKVDMGGMLEGDISRPPAKLLIGNYVLQDAGTILFGQPGGGKSTTAMAWAVSCAWGKEQIWKLGDAWMPLYVNVERSAPSMASRLARVNRALGLDTTTPIPFLNARGRTLADIYEAAKRTIKQEKCQWVIYDSISRAGFGSLIQDDTANKIMDMLNALCPTWVALAHNPRGDNSHAYGSQMFDAAADVTVSLKSQTSRDKLTTGVGLEVMKANDIPSAPMSVHVLEWGSDGLRNIRKGQRGEFAELEAGERRSKEEDVIEYLRRVPDATAGQIADHFGWPRNHTSTMLSHANWAGSQTRGREVYYSLLSDRVPS